MVKMPDAAVPIPSFWSIATSAEVVRRATRIALIVGVVLALINHGDKIMTGTMDIGSWLKGILTFLVPYCVSTYSAVEAARGQARRAKG